MPEIHRIQFHHSKVRPISCDVGHVTLLGLKLQTRNVRRKLHGAHDTSGCRHAAPLTNEVIILEFLTLTSTGHKLKITMELPLFRSLRQKYSRLFHWCLKNYVTTASLNTSSYICLMCNLFPRIYDLVYFSLTTFSHVFVVYFFVVLFFVLFFV